MNTKPFFVLLMLFIFSMGSLSVQAKSDDFPELTGPYLAQKPPGDIPVLDLKIGF